MKHKTMVGLRKWRDKIAVDTPIITRDAFKGIVCKILEDKIRIMFGKGHEMNVNLDDLFPIEWESLILEWATKKHGRDTDIPID